MDMQIQAAAKKQTLRIKKNF